MKSYQEIMTAEEVAEYLRISERTVYEWAQKSEIPCGKLGANWRFRRSDIDEWVNAKLHRNARTDDTPFDLMPLLPEERILFVSSGDKKDVLELLVASFANSPEVENIEDFREGILRRESLMSTGIGLHVGVPHVRLPSIRDVIMAAAVCAQPITDYDAVDGQPVRLVFMIGAHTSQHAQYLRLLSFLSGKLKEGAFRERLLAATSPLSFRMLLLNARGAS